MGSSEVREEEEIVEKDERRVETVVIRNVIFTRSRYTKKY